MVLTRDGTLRNLELHLFALGPLKSGIAQHCLEMPGEKTLGPKALWRYRR